MIILSTYQYYLLNDDLNNRIELNNGFYDNMPIIYVMLSAGALYLQIKN